MTSSVRTIDENSIEVSVELGKSDLQAYIEKAETRLAESLNLDGFRKGKAPREVVRKHIGEARLREEALQTAIEDSLNEVAQKEHIDILDQNNFAIKENSPEKLTYVVTLTLYPKITLGTYRGLEVKKLPVAVSDEELRRALADIATSRTPKGGVAPELNDAFAQGLGNFPTLDALRQEVKEGLLLEKEELEKERIRVELLNGIIATSKIAVPAVMIERQLDTMLQNFDRELHEHGMELGPYLAHVKKTQDELRAGWKPKAEQQVDMSLVIHAVGKAENISVSQEELNEALELQLQQYMAGRPDGGAEALKDIDLDRVKRGLSSALVNQKVFVFLESQSKISS